MICSPPNSSPEYRLFAGHWHRFVLLVVILVALPSSTRASPFEVYGFSSRATAMGGAQGGAARDHPAIYYNPANLTFRENTHLGLGLNLIAPLLYVDTPSTYEGHAPVTPNLNLGFSAGVVFPLGGVLQHRVAVGFAAFLPLLEMTRLESLDPATPHFYMYQSLPDHLVLLPAIGLRLNSWLRAGAGLQVLANMRSEMSITGDVTFRRIEERSLTVDLNSTLGPIIGFTATFGDFDIGLTYRDDIELRYYLPVNFRYAGIGTLAITNGAIALYSPNQLNLGLSYNQPNLVLALDATYAFWSMAPSPAADIEALMSDEDLRPNEPEVELLFDFRTNPFRLGAEDILIVRLGAEWQIDSVFTTRAGFYHRPTPIPDQTGYGNILDSAASVLSFGLAATFLDPLHLNDEPISIDLHLQWTYLHQRDSNKQAEAGALWEGNLSSGGSILNIGLELRQDF